MVSKNLHVFAYMDVSWFDKRPTFCIREPLRL